MFACQWTLTQQRKLLIFRADQSVNNLPITSQQALIHRSLLCLCRRSRNLVDCLQGATRTKAKTRRWQCLSAPRACTCNTLARFSTVECLVFSEFLLHMHSHYELHTILMGFSEFLLYMHNHYQLRTIFMGFSDYLYYLIFFHMHSHY